MMENFFRATGIPNGVVDSNGELVSLSGGENVCSAFHRANTETAERCRESNLDIMRNLQSGCVSGVLCRNGLMDYATPVIIEGQQIATLFLGQVLHEPPDMALFRAQAAQFGFHEKAYLDSIEAIPVVPKKQLQDLMTVMVDMAQMLAESGLAKLRQTVLERDIDRYAERQIQLEDILDSSPIAIGWSNVDGRIEYINRQFTRLFGYTIDDLPNLDAWYQRAYPDEQYRETVIRPWIADAAQAGQRNVPPSELEADITCKDGDVRRVIIGVSWVGQRRLVNFTDITDRWKGEQRNKAHDAIVQMIAQGVESHEIFNVIVGQVEREDKNAKCSILQLDDERKHLLVEAAPSLPAFYNAAIDGIEIGMGVGSCGTAAYLGKRVIVEDVQTHEYWKPYAALARQAEVQSCWSEPFFSSRGEVLGTFAIYHPTPMIPQQEDIERIGFAANLVAIAVENSSARKALERFAYFDYLTGLVNRRRFLELAVTELARAQRHGRDLSLMMFDIDFFKRINDTYGHLIGDKVLQKISEICRLALRDIDIVGRIGGEEFLVLLPESGAAPACQVAERLCADIAATPLILDGGLSLHVSASFGVTTLRKKGTNIDTLIDQADQALYQAKHSGRNRVCTYDGESAALNSVQ